MRKSFLICDDNSETLYVGRISRDESELTEEANALEIGDVTKTREDSKYYLMRDE